MKRSLLLMIAVVCYTAGNAQDIHYSMVNAAPMYYNPATIGMFRGDLLRFSSNYRRQWNSIDNPYGTFSFAADGHFFLIDGEQKPFWGFALGAYNDRQGAGAFTHTNVDLGTSYNIWIDKFNIFSVGALAGFGVRSFSSTFLLWDNQWDGAKFNSEWSHGETYAGGTRYYPDFATGIHWRYLNREETIRIHAGGSIFHLNRPDIGLTTVKDRLPTRIVAQTTADLSISQERTVRMLPTVMHVRHGGTGFWYFGSDIKLLLRAESQITDRKAESSISAGLYKRTNDAFILSMKLTHSGFGIGFAYDITTSTLRSASGIKGGPEVTLTLIPSMGKVAKLYAKGWFL